MNKTEQSKVLTNLTKTKTTGVTADVKKKIQEKTIEEEVLELPLQNI